MLIQSQHLSLHSTMSLLNQILFLLSSHSRPPLHSTMSLLNRCCSARKSATGKNFTFHNVSIKSGVTDVPIPDDVSLHSTMSLLNPKRCAHPAPPAYSFTFHNVSIKSWRAGHGNSRRMPLHSTMSLLNLLMMM